MSLKSAIAKDAVRWLGAEAGNRESGMERHFFFKTKGRSRTMRPQSCSPYGLLMCSDASSAGRSHEASNTIETSKTHPFQGIYLIRHKAPEPPRSGKGKDNHNHNHNHNHNDSIKMHPAKRSKVLLHNGEKYGVVELELDAL